MKRVASGLFVENYGRGLLGNSRVIIHEGGHAIHRQLMTESDVSPFYTQGPNWMFEGFAILNEFLLYDHLYQISTDPRARVYYLEALIDDMSVQPALPGELSVRRIAGDRDVRPGRTRSFRFPESPCRSAAQLFRPQPLAGGDGRRLHEHPEAARG